MLVPILLTKCNLVRSYELLTPKTNVKVLHYLSVRKIYSRVGYLQKKTYLKYYNTQIPEVNFLHNMGKFPKCQRRILQALHMFYKSFNCSREEQDLNLHLSLVYRIPATGEYFIQLNYFPIIWSEQRGSNSQLSAWKADTLPIELCSHNMILS